MTTPRPTEGPGPVGEAAPGDPEAWFLTADERGNPGTLIDARRGDGRAWTAGNDVLVHIDGASYFPRLHAALQGAEPGEHVWITDWEGDASERLDGPETEIGRTLEALARRGVEIKGLLWRSHPRQAHFNEQDNMHLARSVNDDGAELVLDERVRRGGSHHQKIVVVGGPAPARPTDVAFAGGIDLCNGRGDDGRHQGDPQVNGDLDPVYGDRPPWHDAQLEVRGPAVSDLAWTFRERWNDHAPLDHRNPVRAVQRRLLRQPRVLEPLPEPPVRPRGTGPHQVQVLRTYPSRRPRYAFAPAGERSIARAHLKALRRARRLVVIEDQYLWSRDGAEALADALRTYRELQLVIVVPRFPDQDGRFSGPANRYARHRFIQLVRAAGGPRVAVYDLVNDAGTPIYVHAKVCVIDDVWLEVGSDNLNRRSWTHDSEVGCSVLDETLDQREPPDPGGQGDGARVLARETRLALWREHLGRAAGYDADLVEPGSAFDALAASAARLAAWADGDRRGPRPPGHLAVHHSDPGPRWMRPLAAVAYRTTLDPDGRPGDLRRASTY
ncbi:MAG TPA: phospholipase D family protein [Aquihabitans sp.]|nr:phospholipase D family protein [Aquihabitans sp.]